MRKYVEYVERMMAAHKAEFDEFGQIHDKFLVDPKNNQEKFNMIGLEINVILNDWENKLCSQSEKGGFSHYTPKLAEKFRDEVRRRFSMIDHIGIKVSYTNPPSDTEGFNLKKISF